MERSIHYIIRNPFTAEKIEVMVPNRSNPYPNIPHDQAALHCLGPKNRIINKPGFLKIQCKGDKDRVFYAGYRVEALQVNEFQVVDSAGRRAAAGELDGRGSAAAERDVTHSVATDRPHTHPQ